jgi:hypothetical protein
VKELWPRNSSPKKILPDNYKHGKQWLIDEPQEDLKVYKSKKLTL